MVFPVKTHGLSCMLSHVQKASHQFAVEPLGKIMTEQDV